MLIVEFWRNVARGVTEIYIRKHNPETGEYTIAKPMEFEFVENKEGDPNEPTMSFPDREGEQFLNALAQALIQAGYRDKAVSKDGEIKRLQEHLQDMRTIAFNGLKIELKEK